MEYEIDVLESFAADVTVALAAIDSLSFRAKLIAEIDREMIVLRDMPFLHAVSRKPALRRYGMREAFILSYSLVYRVQGGRVQMVRLFHQRQDYGLHDPHAVNAGG